jgi:hypothetical protein
VRWLRRAAIVVILFSAQARAQLRDTVAMAKRPDSTLSISLTILDSLYSSRDTAALRTAVARLGPDSSSAAMLYRGVSLAWAGQSTRASEVLRPLLEIRDSGLTRFQRRAVLRTLTESYARMRRYDSLTAHYDRELRALDASLDSAERVQRERELEPEPILESLTSPEPLPRPAPERVPRELGFIGLLFALFLLPKILQRFRIPSAITSLCMGAGATAMGWLIHDPTVNLLSTLGIVTLFLFAGLEIDADELKQFAYPLALHAAIWSVLAVITALLFAKVLGESARVSALLALAVVKPSNGLIL